ncbi:MAG TPA: TMEM165/GDT1 family protein [Candidatus Thermoplasmatota archaeon]|nr:TMEM165/GDT1 family protein [Candidatus Thermoplasmatota archaeon]
MGPGTAALSAFGLVFLAELGDKSQVLLVAQAARRPAVRVLVESVLAFALLTVLAVTVGALVARIVPAFLLAVASGLLFLVFGVLGMREAAGDAPAKERFAGLRYGGTFSLLFVSEMGDKTQLVTAALAASSDQAFATALGAFAALALSSALAVLAGSALVGRLDPKRRAAYAALLFFVVGLATLVYAVWTQVEFP